MVRAWAYVLLTAGLLVATCGDLHAQDESPPLDSVYGTGENWEEVPASRIRWESRNRM